MWFDLLMFWKKEYTCLQIIQFTSSKPIITPQTGCTYVDVWVKQINKKSNVFFKKTMVSLLSKYSGKPKQKSYILVSWLFQFLNNDVLSLTSNLHSACGIMSNLSNSHAGSKTTKKDTTERFCWRAETPWW